MANTTYKPFSPLFHFLFTASVVINSISSQKTCPPCGSLEVPYPLSTDPSCGERDYSSLRCDRATKTLFFEALNGTSYKVRSVSARLRRLILEPSPWLSDDDCVTRDMDSGEGLWLNRSLPFNVTPSNTVFLLNCSPRLLASPLNCTGSSLCREYLARSSRVGPGRAARCAGDLRPCCTFVAGGMPSAYKIRLRRSGCQALRSVVGLDEGKPASEWKEGLEIQWGLPREPCETCVTRNRRRGSLLGVKVTIGVALFLFFSLGISTAIFLCVRKKGSVELEDGSRSSSAKIFGMKEMRRATKGFSKDLILGTGGFGEVYKGELKDGTIVAVKSAKVGNLKSKEQIMNEVEILSQVNHKNLVKLLGCCLDSKQPLMIYEFISNGTLHAHLHRKFPDFLDWKTRLKIAHQTAEALAYLHSSAHTPIFHRDVKSTNILLDEGFNAKVADFGISRLASPGLSHVSTCAQGTLGYLDPEYYRNYQLSDKSDVYSFGVVLLELLTSQNAIDFFRDEEEINLAIYARVRASKGSFLGIVDRGLLDRICSDEGDSAFLRSLELFLELSLSCLSERKAERPDMRAVVQELHSIIGIVEKQEM